MTLAALDADPAGIRAYAGALREVARRAEELVTTGTAAVSADGWEGLAEERYADVVAASRRRADAVAATVHELARRVEEHADVVAVLLRRRAELAAAGSAPGDAEVLAWERDLAAEEQAMRQALAGGTTRERHAVHVAALQRDLDRLGRLARLGGLTDAEQLWWENARATRVALDRAAEAVDPVTGRPVPAYLHDYDPTAYDGDGRVAIVVGDADRADDVALVVPGFGTDMTSASHQVERAITLHEAARHLDPRAANATVAWIGYDAPDNLPVVGDGDAAGVLTDKMAVDGADRLARDVDAIRAARGDDPAHVTVIGYSYGSTVAGAAAAGPGLAADDLVLVGSPGAGGDADTVADTGLPASRVWVARNSHDLVALLGGLGEDPAGEQWGGTRVRAESATRGEGPAFWADHEAYFDHDTESLHNIGLVVAGERDEVDRAEPVRGTWRDGVVDPEAARRVTTPATRPR